MSIEDARALRSVAPVGAMVADFARSRWRRRRTSKSGRRMLVEPVLGLANRVRAVLSTSVIARHCGLEIDFLWEAGRGFSEARWQDLFANPLPALSRAQFEVCAQEVTYDVQTWIRPDAGPRASASGEFDRGRVLSDFQSGGVVYRSASENLIAKLRVLGARQLRWLVPEYERACRSLRPADSIARIVDDHVRRAFEGRSVVGLHVRRGDAVLGGQSDEYLRSDDDAFLRAIDDELRRDPTTHFFLATDCAETQERFIRAHASRLLTFEKPFVESRVRAPKQGQVDAATELFLLSHTRRVIGTHYSSFGLLAAQVGGVAFRRAE